MWVAKVILKRNLKRFYPFRMNQRQLESEVKGNNKNHMILNKSFVRNVNQVSGVQARVETLLSSHLSAMGRLSLVSWRLCRRQKILKLNLRPTFKHVGYWLSAILVGRGGCRRFGFRQNHPPPIINHTASKEPCSRNSL
jgi:hypothetical protein